MKTFSEGYRDFGLGVKLNDNPYDKAVQPTLFKNWKQGWKQAAFDEKEKEKE